MPQGMASARVPGAGRF